MQADSEVEEEVRVPDNDEDSSSVSSDEEAAHPVYLGFPAENDDDDDETLPVGELPSAVGGRPVWMRNPSQVQPSELCCFSCSAPMPLLMQLYAPLELSPQTHHRTLTVFVCPRGECWGGREIPATALRSQWAAEEKIEALGDDKVCRVCGKPASKVCGKCKSRRYCSQMHQAADWSAGHKRYCGKPEAGEEKLVSGAAVDAKMVFKRITIETEMEEYKLDKDAVKDFAVTNDALLSDELRTKMLPPTAQESEMLKQMKKADSTFLKFQARVRDNQDQVVRYSFGAQKPLWVNASKQLIGDPPKCDLCGAMRVFEFQIMPQVLFFLGVDSKEEKAMDWSSLIVYSCEKSCETVGYAKEFIFAH